MNRCKYCGSDSWTKSKLNSGSDMWICNKCGCSTVKDPSISEIADRLYEKLMEGKI